MLGSENISAFVHCDQVGNIEEKYRLVSSEVDSSSGEAATGHNDAEIRPPMVYHAVKITNNMRADTRNMSLALDDSLETASCHFYVDSTIARTGRDSRIELMSLEYFSGRPFKCVAIEELPVRALAQFGVACGFACGFLGGGLLFIVAVNRLPIRF